MRKLAAILFLNVIVIGIVAAVIVRYPEYARIAALLMPALFILDFLFLRRQQKQRAENIATGKAAPLSPNTMKMVMWILAGYGAVSYVSGAFNIPGLLREDESAMWLGWAVKMGMGTLCLWSAYKVHRSLRKQGN